MLFKGLNSPTFSCQRSPVIDATNLMPMVDTKFSLPDQSPFTIHANVLLTPST